MRRRGKARIIAGVLSIALSVNLASFFSLAQEPDKQYQNEISDDFAEQEQMQEQEQEQEQEQKQGQEQVQAQEQKQEQEQERDIYILPDVKVEQKTTEETGQDGTYEYEDSAAETEENEESLDPEVNAEENADDEDIFGVTGAAIEYSGHQQTYGDLGQAADGAVLGNIGESKRLEAVTIFKGGALEGIPGEIKYRAHVQNYGDVQWVTSGQSVGTRGESKRLEAIQIVLTGELAEQYDIYYRTHIQRYGWLKWTKGTEDAGGWSGSSGLSLRIEAVQIKIVPKEEAGPDDSDAQTPHNYVTSGTGKAVMYSGHQQTYGDLSGVSDGEQLGTTGQSKRLEALTVKKGNDIAGIDGSIVYRVHGQTYGTSGWVSDGQAAGVTGQSKRIEAVQIYLTGELAEQYDVYYTAHVQKFGWMKWTKGSSEDSGWCGTSGLSLRAEAVKIQLVPKGGEIPVNEGQYSYVTKESFGSVVYSGHMQTYGDLGNVADGVTLGRENESKRLETMRISLSNNSNNPITGSIRYRSHVQGTGWQSWVSDGQSSGTIGQAKRIEAVQIELAGDISKYCDVWYRTCVQEYGWLGWAKNGQEAGTSGLSYLMKGIQVRLVPKGSAAPGANDGYFVSMTPQESRVYQNVVNVYNQVGRDLWACYNWVVNTMSYERIAGHVTPPSGYTRCQWYAIMAFENHRGNCYCYAAAFYYLAKYLGYNAEYVEGSVTKRGGGYTPHGWVVIDGAYICDPEAQAEIARGLNFYMQPIGNTRLSYVR